jgi:hypothetical protein
MLIKLRFRFPDVLFGVLLAVAIFAMGAVFWSSPNSSTPTQTQTDTKSGERNPGKQEIAWWQDPVAVFTLGLVFIGLVQAGIFYGQMRLIRRSLAPAEQAARAAQAAAEHIPTIERAYMFGGPHEIGLEGGKEGVAFVISGHQRGQNPRVFEIRFLRNVGDRPRRHPSCLHTN